MTAKTDLTVIDFDAATATEIRKLAAEYGIKGASRGKKADLTAALAPFVAEQRKAKEEAAKPAKKAKPAKIRKERFSQDELAGWENTHSDNAHADLGGDAKIDLEGWNFKTQADLDEWVAEERATMERCPICHPEIVINSAHSGSSRAGMVINVPLRADGRTKAETVAARLDAVKIPAKIRRFKGEEILTAEIDGNELKLVWDAQGRYVYALSKFGTRKVRNVSEALRLAVTA